MFEKQNNIVIINCVSRVCMVVICTFVNPYKIFDQFYYYMREKIFNFFLRGWGDKTTIYVIRWYKVAVLHTFVQIFKKKGGRGDKESFGCIIWWKLNVAMNGKWNYMYMLYFENKLTFNKCLKYLSIAFYLFHTSFTLKNVFEWKLTLNWMSEKIRH